MKKTVKYLLTVTALITLICVVTFSSFAATDEKTYTDENGDTFKYTVANGEVTITGFSSEREAADVVIPDAIEDLPVTVIGDNSFQEKSIKSVHISDNVKSVGDYAFYRCAALETLTFGNINEYMIVGDYAFSESGFKTLYIPEGVWLNQGVFKGCENLISAVVDGEYNIEAYQDGYQTKYKFSEFLFKDCTNLKDVTLCSKFNTIYEGMFENCTSLENIDFSARNIEIRAFMNCTSLKKIELVPNTNVGNSGFENCTSLSEIDFTKVNSFVGSGVRAFYNCTSLTDIDLSGITYVCSSTFANCTSLRSLGDFKPVLIGSEAFLNCRQLKYVDMSGLKDISTGTFKGCSSLESVDLSNIDKIYEHAFEGCTSLKELEIPKQMYIYDYAFKDCTGIEKIIFADTVERIDGGAPYTGRGKLFEGCTGVKYLYLGAGFLGTPIYYTPQLNVAELGLEHLTGLEEIEVSPDNPYYFTDDGVLYLNFNCEGEEAVLLVCYPAGKKDAKYSTKTALQNIDKPFSIAARAFYNTQYLKELEITRPVAGASLEILSERILTEAFANSSVEKITFTEGGFENIGYKMFKGGNIRYIDLNTVNVVDDRAFEDCKNLLHINLPECIYVGESAFENSTVQTVELPKCERIENYAFKKCENLKTVNAQNCTEVGKNVFYQCVDLTGVDLRNCISLGDHAFYECGNLKNIRLDKCEVIAPYTFYCCTSLEEINLYSCEDIKVYAFYGCTSLKRANLVAVKNIYDYAFADCTELALVQFGQKDGYIYKTAFENDEKLAFYCEPNSFASGFARRNNIPRYTIEVSFSQGEYQYTGNALRPGVIVRIGETQLVQNKDFTLEFDNNVNVGVATVTIHFIGGFEGLPDAVRTFEIVGRQVSDLTFEYVEDNIFSGEEIKPVVVVKYGDKTLTEGVDYRIEYKSGSDAGTMLFTVYGMGQYAGKVDCYYNIIRRDIAEATAGKIPDSTYTGSPVCPEPTLKWNGFTLVKDVDYEVRYFENVNTGFATMVIYGKGNFCGTLKIQYRIFGKNIETVIVSAVGDKEYTGEAITPDVTVTFDGKTLTKDVDYTVEYKNNIESGTAQIVINGIGNYSGTKTQTFKIYKNSVYSFTVFSETQMTATYDGTPLKPEMEVYFGETLLTEGVDYIVKLENNINAGTATVTICGIGKFEGERSFGFTILPCTVNENDITVSGDMKYNGTAVEPKIAVTKNGATLLNGTDYTVTYQNNDAVGTAYMTVTGIGNYQGDVEIEYEIYAPEAPDVPDDKNEPADANTQPSNDKNVEIPNTDFDERTASAFLIALGSIGLIIYALNGQKRKPNKI